MERGPRLIMHLRVLMVTGLRDLRRKSTKQSPVPVSCPLRRSCSRFKTSVGHGCSYDKRTMRQKTVRLKTVRVQAVRIQVVRQDVAVARDHTAQSPHLHDNAVPFALRAALPRTRRRNIAAAVTEPIRQSRTESTSVRSMVRRTTGDRI